MMQFYQITQKQSFRFILISLLINLSLTSYSQLIVTIDDGTQDFCYGDSIEINHISFEESDTNNFRHIAGDGTININVPNGFKAYSNGNTVTVDPGSGTSNIYATDLDYNNDSSQIILTYQIGNDDNKEKISIEDIVLKPKAGQASYGTQFTIDGNGYLGFDGATDIDTTIGRFRMNNPEIELDSVTTQDGCSNNPLTLHFKLNNIYAISCVDSFMVNLQGKAPNNTLVEQLYVGEINERTFSFSTDDIGENDSLIYVNVFCANVSISDTFYIGDSTSGKDIMLLPSQEVEYNSNQFSTSAYLSRYYMRDTITNYEELNTIDASRFNNYYYSFEVLSESSPVPGAVGVNTYSNSKSHYLNSSGIGAGIYDMVMSREHPVSHCIVRDTIELIIVPDVVDVADVFCYRSDTTDTVTVSRSWVESYPVEGTGVHRSITKINRLIVKYGEHNDIELSPVDSSKSDVKYPFNPTEIYDSVTAGLATPPKEIFIQFELYANVDLYEEVPYTNCIPYLGCYTWYISELMTTLTIPIESATATILQGNNDGYLIGLDTTLCQNQEAIELIGSYFTDSISEPAYKQGNDWLLNPVSDFPNKDSVFSITYYYRDNNNCPEDTTLNINIYEVPKLDLSFTTICVGDTVNFSQNNPIRTDTNNINKWNWSFGDGFILTNETTTDTIIANNTHGGRTSGTYRLPSHMYDEANTYNISLTTSTDIGCESQKDTTIVIGSHPIADFSYTGKITEAPIRISNLSANESFDPVSNYAWVITDPSGDTSKINSTIPESVDTTFTESGVYNIELTVTTNNGCVGTKQRKIPSFPIIKVEPGNFYDQGFGNSTLPEGWIASKEYLPQVSGWKYAQVAGEYNDNDKHTTGYMWLTGDPQDTIRNESGWVESPCFDLSDLDLPMLSIDVFQSIEEKRDGGVVQYTLDDGNTWETFGALGTGNNWYNARGISSTPGVDTNSVNNNGYGWSENTKAWATARHALEEVRDINNSGCVRFRILFNSDNYTDSSCTGFAFDNVYVGKRKRVILVEEFTCSEFAQTDQTQLGAFLSTRPKEICNIRYPVAIGHDRDILFDYTCWQDASARATEYGVMRELKTVMDGKVLDESLYNKFSVRALNDPTFEIFDVTATENEGALNISAKVQKLSNRLVEQYGEHQSMVRIAIVQKEVMDSEGEVHNNIVVDLLPGGIGNIVEKIESDTEVGSVIDINETWIPNIRTVGNDFRLVIYVQSRWGIDEVQQVWFDDIPTTSIPQVATGISNTGLSKGFEIYPNPMRDKFYIISPETFSNDLTWSVYSLSGMLVKQGTIYSGNKEIVVNAEGLAKGLYLVELKSSDGTKACKKIAKILD